MLYNLSKYISENTSYIPATGGLEQDSSSNLVLLQTGGSEDHRIGTKRYSVQFLSRAKSKPEAYKIISAIYSLLSNRFNIVLPEVTVDAIVYPSLTTASILSLQIPGYVGTDANGLHEWSVNFSIIL